MKAIRLRCRGLVTEPSGLAAGQMDALELAENVMLRRSDLIEPRPGFTRPAGLVASPGGTYLPKSLHALHNEVGAATDDLLIASRNDASAWDFRWAFDGSTVAGLDAPPTDGFMDHASVQARGSLYLTTTAGLRKIEKIAAAYTALKPIYSVGAVELTLSSAGTPQMLATGNTVAYRVCVRRTDANGYITRTDPSPYQRISNSSGATRDVVVRVPLPAYIVSGDVLEIYRSKIVTGATVTAVPSDEMYLAYEQTLGVAGPSVVSITDNNMEGTLGRALYTNGTVEGIAQANEPPPVAHEVAYWRDVLWLANTVGRFRLDTTYRPTGPTLYTSSLGVRTYTGDFTSGSAVITNIASTAGVIVGQLVFDGATPLAVGTNVAANTKVVSFTATTITMSNNALATQAGATFQTSDIVKVGSTELYAFSSTVENDRAFFSAALNPRGTIAALAYIVSLKDTLVYAVYDDTSTDATAVGLTFIEREAAVGNTAFTVYTTRSDQFSPALGTSITSGQASTRDALDNGLAWSKVREPEAVPLVQQARVGRDDRRICRLVPLRDALLVFTEGGLYRITGDPPNAWRIDPMDPNLDVYVPDAVTRIEDTAYALTNRGVIAATDFGVEALSDPVIGRSLRPTEITYRYGYTASREGLFMAAHPRRRLVVLALSGGSLSQETWYVWSLSTRTWTTWRMRVGGSRGALYVDQRGTWLVPRRLTTWEVREERSAEVDADLVRDVARSITISSTGGDGKTITLSAGDGWFPAVGDVVQQGGTEVTVNGVSGATSFTVDAAGLNPAAATAVEVIAADVQWAPIMPADPHRVALWREVLLSLEASFSGNYTTLPVTLGASHDRDSTFRSVSATYTFGSATEEQTLRAFLSRQVARAARIRPRVQIARPDIYWSITGLSLVYEPVSERTARA